MEEEKVNLIYIGDKFYFESGTSMSSLYSEDGERHCWATVDLALKDGKEVCIRPATDAEFVRYQRKLDQFKEDRRARWKTQEKR